MIKNIDTPDLRLMRAREVMAQTGLSRSALYRGLASGEFPKPIKISERAIAWDSRAVERWIADRIDASRGAA